MMENNTIKEFTCILPISSANKTSPDMQIDTANMISPTNLLVLRFCPNALQRESDQISL